MGPSNPVSPPEDPTSTPLERSRMSNSVSDSEVSTARNWSLVGQLPGESELQRINIPSAGATVGRSSRVADIVLPSTFVSIRHARLVPTSLGLEISDVGSRNGTFVRRERIEGIQIAEAGDTVAFADIEFQLQARASDEAPDQHLGCTNILGADIL